MVAKKRGLGRGLDALLGGSARTAATAEETFESTEAPGTTESAEPGQPPSTAGELRELPVDLLQPGKYQPRTDMHQESLQDLANSIKAQGVLQPIVVRKIDGGRYEIIAGERRWRAAQLAELHNVPAVIRDVPDEAAIAMALIENIQRENLNPIEEASALQRLIGEFELTHQQAADAVGRSRAAVSNLLRLLSLNPDVRLLLDYRSGKQSNWLTTCATQRRQNLKLQKLLIPIFNVCRTNWRKNSALKWLCSMPIAARGNWWCTTIVSMNWTEFSLTSSNSPLSILHTILSFCNIPR
jgi:ParB/RepB/Spo0J family partition protein